MTNTFDIVHVDMIHKNVNHSSVRRHSVTMPDTTGIRDRDLMKQAKALFGLTGVRGVTEKSGDGIEFRPYRSCIVLSITAQKD